MGDFQLDIWNFSPSVEKEMLILNAKEQQGSDSSSTCIPSPLISPDFSITDAIYSVKSFWPQGPLCGINSAKYLLKSIKRGLT
jgi:hypothetical protein